MVKVGQGPTHLVGEGMARPHTEGVLALPPLFPSLPWAWDSGMQECEGEEFQSWLSG